MAKLTIVVAVLAVFAGVYFASLQRIPVPSPSASAVLITGSSTGIGNHAAIQLAKAGYLVFAGVRKQADGEALVATATAEGAGANIVPVLIDVSVSESIASAARNVSELLSGTYKDRKLAAIVNNAGIGYLAAVETIPMHAVKSLFEVNVFGLVETTQVFLPMLHAHGPGARIVNIGSISGIYSPPSHAIYAATKYAVEAISDGLRVELYEFGIGVTNIEPGVILTPIVSKMSQSKKHGESESVPARIRDVYNRLYHNFLASYDDIVQWGLAESVDATSAAVLKALSATSPPDRIVVGLDAWLLTFATRWLPVPVFDAINRLHLLKPIEQMNKA